MLHSVTTQSYLKRSGNLTRAANVGEPYLNGPQDDADRYRLRHELEKCREIRDALMTLKENACEHRGPEIDRGLLKITLRIQELEEELSK